MSEWQTIETAPVRQFCLVYDGYSGMILHAIKMEAVNAKGEDKGFAWFTGYKWGDVSPVVKPTHWMPIPADPTTEQKDEA